MAQAQTTSNRSEGAKKAAATRAANAAAKKGVVEGPKGKVLKDNEATEQHEVPQEQRQGERRQQQQNAIAQFTASSMQTPAAHENPTPDENAEAIKQKAFQDAVQALAQSMGVQVPPQLLAAPAQAQQRAPRQDRQSQNGITRPASGTKTGEIWDLADKLSAENGGNPIPVGTLRQHADMKQVNDNTLKTQFARWRSYHGIKGRATPPAPQVQNEAYTGPERRNAEPQQ